jgi:hypothetical protein
VQQDGRRDRPALVGARPADGDRRGLLFATSAATAQGTDLRADRRLQLTELISRERSELRAAERARAGSGTEVESLAAQAAAQDGRVAAVTAGPSWSWPLVWSLSRDRR